MNSALSEPHKRRAGGCLWTDTPPYSLEHHERKELKWFDTNFLPLAEIKVSDLGGSVVHARVFFCSQLSSPGSATWRSSHRTTSHGRLTCGRQEHCTVLRPYFNLLILPLPLLTCLLYELYTCFIV